MEAFSLLNYWKNSGGGGGVSSGLSFLPQSSDSSCRHSGDATTIVTSVSVTETEEETDDEGPFFDLQFALPLEEEDNNKHDGGEEGEEDSECEFKFTLSSCSGGEERVDPDLVFSPSDDVYFKEQIVEEVEPPSTETCSVKAPAAQLSASILKSATKLRVFMLNIKKSKLKSEKPNGSGESNKQPPPPPPPPPSSHSPETQQKSNVTVNLKVEEVPIISLFTRGNSSSSSSSSSSVSVTKKQNGNESVVLAEENRFVMMQKYLKKVKPLYVRVSRRYGEKLKHSGQLSLRSSSSSSSTETPVPVTKGHKPGNININIPAGLKVVRKHLGKSRSSSSTTTTTTTTQSSTITMTGTTSSESRRRDDSLLQQQDSIQSAILHCKRSFNSSRDKDPSVLPRSVSDPSSYDK